MVVKNMSTIKGSKEALEWLDSFSFDHIHKNKINLSS